MEGRIEAADRAIRRLLVVIVVLLAVIAAQLWVSTPVLPRAEAQIPNTGLQRKHIVDECKRTNQLLAQILAHLQTKPIKVDLQESDRPKDRKRRRSGG